MVSTYQRPTRNVYIQSVDSIEYKRQQLISVGQLRYGRRGDSNYYAMIALWDVQMLDKHKDKEHFSTKGRSYNQVIEDLYNKVFN